MAEGTSDGLESRPLVYFICIGNAMRSQMAEGFLRKLAGDRFRAASAGTRPLGSVLPEVVEVMRDVGIDLSGHLSVGLDEDLVREAVLIVDLGGEVADRLPSAYIHKLERWRVQDPYGMDRGGLVATRDEIRARVERLVAYWERS